MTGLPPLTLDDLTFDDLRSAALQRIPAESAGRWTLHAAVDPGVTLLELFAYLLDQRLFQLDHVPDAALRGVIALLGDQVQPSRPAATVIELNQEEPAPPIPLDAGAEVTLDRSSAEMVFTTDTELVVLPGAKAGVEVSGADRTDDLASGRAVTLFPADATAAEAKFVLEANLAPPIPAGHAALLLRLAGVTDDKVAPEWLAEADEATVSPPTQVTYAYRGAGSALPVPFPAGGVEDGTRGLRRSGLVRFQIPADWEPDAAPGPNGLAPYSLFVRAESATFTSLPLLQAVVPNTVVARHRAKRSLSDKQLEANVNGWLSLPGQTIDCGAPGLLRESPDTVTVRLREASAPQEMTEWAATADLGFHGPQDRVFVIDRVGGKLRFGDGLNGRIPVLESAAPLAQVTFEIGAGVAGNFGSDASWRVSDAEQLDARNVVASAGGADTESLEAARDRIGRSLSSSTRAVTRADFEYLARDTLGVDIARAHAAVGFHPAHPCTPVPGAVTVFVVPNAPRDGINPGAWVAAPQPDPGAVAAVTAHLGEARLLTTELFVRPPRYRRVRIEVALQSEPSNPDRLRTLLGDALVLFLDPLVGGDDQSGWPFGEPLRPSALLRQAQIAVGNEAAIAAVSVGIDGAPPAESCRDVPIGPHDLVLAERVDVRWEPQPVASEAGIR